MTTLLYAIGYFAIALSAKVAADYLCEWMDKWERTEKRRYAPKAFTIPARPDPLPTTLPVAPPANDKYKQQISELKSKVSSLNKDLAKNRNLVSSFTKLVPMLLPQEDSQIEEQPEEEEKVCTWVGPVRFSSFTTEASKDLWKVPFNQQRLAMETLGALSAGKENQTLKKLHVEGVWSVRLGFHYRMLLNVTPNEIHVLRIINRKDQDTALKLLKSSLRSA